MDPHPASPTGTESPSPKKQKTIETEEWDDEPSRFIENENTERRMENACIFLDQATKEQLKAHQHAFYQAKGYEISVAAPERFKGQLVDVVPMNDPVFSKLVQEGAELALAEHKRRTSTELKLEKVLEANFSNIGCGYDYFITLEATGKDNSSKTYQTRVTSRGYGSLEKLVGAHAFRPKPKSN